MQVGQVLDLRHRQQAGQPGAESHAEDRLLVKQRVEDPASAEGAEQALGDPVDAALAGHVLAEHDQFRSGGQFVGQRSVDRLCQRQRARFLRQPPRDPPFPPNAPKARCLASGEAGLIAAATIAGLRGASGVITCAAEVSLGSASARAANARTLALDCS